VGSLLPTLQAGHSLLIESYIKGIELTGGVINCLNPD
jgi:hypothetical protein